MDKVMNCLQTNFVTILKSKINPCEMINFIFSFIYGDRRVKWDQPKRWKVEIARQCVIS